VYSILYSQHALWAVRPDAEQHGALVLWSSKNCGSRRTLQLDHVKTERGEERERERERARKQRERENGITVTREYRPWNEQFQEVCKSRMQVECLLISLLAVAANESSLEMGSSTYRPLENLSILPYRCICILRYEHMHVFRRHKRDVMP